MLFEPLPELRRLLARCAWASRRMRSSTSLASTSSLLGPRRSRRAPAGRGPTCGPALPAARAVPSSRARSSRDRSPACIIRRTMSSSRCRTSSSTSTSGSTIGFSISTLSSTAWPTWLLRLVLLASSEVLAGSVTRSAARSSNSPRSLANSSSRSGTSRRLTSWTVSLVAHRLAGQLGPCVLLRDSPPRSRARAPACAPSSFSLKVGQVVLSRRPRSSSARARRLAFLRRPLHVATGSRRR